MTYEQKEARRAELKVEFPNGVKSGNEIDRIIMFEDLAERIGDIPVDHLREVLTDMLDLVRSA